MSKIIPKRMVEEIRFRNDIVELIGSYFNLKRAGSGFTALCPFHKEKSPSFHVHPQKQIFHCFGCGVGGDVFRFVMQHEGVDFPTAVRMLAQKAGVPVEWEDDEEDTGGPRKDDLFRLHEELAQFYQRCLVQLKAAERARRYLAGRELAGDIAATFRIGYAPKRWDAVMGWAKKNHFTPEQVEAAGVVARATPPVTRGREVYDRFRDRLMFPIQDEQGRVIGFSGRLLDEDAKAAKYVNSPETALFKKSRILYAMDKARKPMVDSREAIVCEGQIDVIRCHQAGFNTAVASQGTAFTEDHARILRRYADSAVIVFDPDKAGQDASVRTATLFMQAGLAVRVAALPAKEDPASFIRTRGAGAFREVLDAATSAVGFQVTVLGGRENLRSEVGVMRAAKAVLDTISHSPNAVQRARLVQEAAQRLNLPASALQDDLRFLLRRAHGRAEARQPGQVRETRADVPRPAEEVELCKHMTHVVDQPELGDLVRQYLPLDMISDDACRAIVKASMDAAEQGQDLLEAVRAIDDDPEGALQPFAVQIQMAPEKIKGEEFSHVDAVKDLVLRLWRRRFERERADLQTRSPPTGDDTERRAQITYHLNRMKQWPDGAAIIEIELTP